jgi:hypothetical protein
MKKKIFKVSILASMMMLLTACPYQSKVPISKPDEKISKDLLGDWIATSELEYDNPTYYSIAKFSKVKYEVVENSYSTYDSTYSEKKYFMHSSTLGDRTFMNVQEASGGDYYLHYLEIGDNEFTLFEVSENIDEQFTSSAALKAFVEKNMELSFFYSKSEVKYIKKSKK